MAKISGRSTVSERKPDGSRGWVRQGLIACGILSLALALCAEAHAQIPVPQIANPLVPNTAAPETPGLTLTVNGAGFISTSVVNWNGSALVTSFISNHQLQAVVPAANLATAGSAEVTVVNAGSPASSIVFFTIAKSRGLSGFGKLDFPTGSNPVGVTIGDFDRNGTLDMAIANDKDDTVQILLGNGDGTFTAGATYTLKGSPINIVSADLTGNGILDLITANQLSSHIAVFLGNGDGTFQAPQYFATGLHPMSLTFGDFNGNGKIDIATPNFADNTISVLLGNGDGTFQPGVPYPVGAGPLDVKAADLHGDGILDLVSVNNDNKSISVLQGIGNGTFMPEIRYATASKPNSLGVADLNGDGFPDIVTSNGTSSISILLNSGTGTFPTHTEYPSNSYPAYVVGLADFNNDGRVDVVVPNFNSDQVSLFYGNGDGTLQMPPKIFAVDTNPDAIGIADFNRDGLLDVAVLNEFAQSVSILTQSSAASVRVEPMTIKFPYTLAGFMSKPVTVTVTNTGSNALVINSIALAGPNPDQFSIPTNLNTCPASLASQASCTIGVIFAPTNDLVSYANLEINDSAGTQTVALSGRGQIHFTLAPTDFIDFDKMFGPVLIGTSVTAMPSTTLMNQSKVSLTINSISIMGQDTQDYSQNNDCVGMIGPLGSCTITIMFTPAAIRHRTATVIILSQSSTPKRGISLRGVGTEITYSPACHCLNFGSVPVGMKSQMTVTFSNSGSTALPIKSIVIDGKRTFSQTNTCNGNIPANGSCVFTVTFKPKVVGNDMAELKVKDDDPTSPQVVKLSGMGSAGAPTARR
jgi:hypothetical protein